MSRTPHIPVILLMSLFLITSLVSCVPSNEVIPSAEIATEVATATTEPTEIVTATPEAGIDMEKFTNFPQSYDYLLTHLNEFVQAPDPVTDRVAFDKWFTEELVTALGPVSERERNIDAYIQNARYSLGFQNGNDGHAITGHIHSFYFISDDVVYFVPCFHAFKDGYDQGVMTVCVALFDHPQLYNYGNSGIEALAQGKLYHGYVYFNPKMDRPDLDYGDMEPIIESVGEYIDFENLVMFGFGFIVP